MHVRVYPRWGIFWQEVPGVLRLVDYQTSERRGGRERGGREGGENIDQTLQINVDGR